VINEGEFLHPPVLLIIKISMSKEHWWNNVDKEIQKYSKENVSQGHFHYHKSYNNRTGIEP
jgi:hypothetical protein